MSTITVPEQIEALYLGYISYSATGEGITLAVSCQDSVDDVVQTLHGSVDDFLLNGLVVISLNEILLPQHESALFAIQHCTPYLWKALKGELNLIGKFNSLGYLHINHS